MGCPVVNSNLLYDRKGLHMLNLDKNNNSTKTLDIDLVHNAIHELNYKFNTYIDSSQFFDAVMSNFCTAVIDNNNLLLSFPVVATNKYAAVSFMIDETVLNTEEIEFNKAFELEIHRVQKRHM